MALVEDGARDDADRDKEKGLNGTDPRDLGGGVFRKEVILIVGLVDTERIDDAPRNDACSVEGFLHEHIG